MQQFKTREFKKLQSKWYKKLEKSGFEEAENTALESNPLKKWHSSYFQAVSHGAENAIFKQEYFRLAGIFLHDYSFETRKDMKVWALHAQGLPIREIARLCKTQKDKIHKTIKLLTREMFKVT